ncbi:hypothetical protein [Streptomyces sp. NPDC090056]|uniref:hypothetical protein n=1 Tax=Streptomyces sp. NPDC090056 TaxID=3365934 RepID=UPI0038133A93
MPGDPVLAALLVTEPATRSAEAVDRLWSADGTLAPVRHAFARRKHRRILRDCRQRRIGIHRMAQALRPHAQLCSRHMPRQPPASP